MTTLDDLTTTGTDLTKTVACHWPDCTAPATWQHRLGDIGGPCVGSSNLCAQHHARALRAVERIVVDYGGLACGLHDVPRAWTWRAL